jgi:hypothetical protein
MHVCTFIRHCIRQTLGSPKEVVAQWQSHHGKVQRVLFFINEEKYVLGRIQQWEKLPVIAV